MKRYSFYFLLVMLNLFQHINSFAQTAWIDTNYIKAHVDSCKTLNTSKQKITCGHELLKLIRLDIGAAKNQKEKICLSTAEANTFRNMGNAYKNMGMTSKAMEYYQMSKEKAEKINYKRGIAAALLNSGIIYQEIAKDTADHKKALHFFEQSLKAFQEINDKIGIGLCWSSLGVTYQNLNKDKTALENFEKSIGVFEEIQDKNNVANNFRNAGHSYEKLFDYESALENYKKSLSIYEELDDSSEIGLSLAGIGNIYQLKGNMKKADEYYSRVLQIAKKTQNLSTEAEALKAIKDIYRKQGKYKEALDINDNYMAVNDSDMQLQKVEDIAKMEMQSYFTKKEATTKVEHEKQIAIEEERQQKLRVIISSVIGGLLLVVVFSIFILNRWHVTQRQKKIIEIQKVEVEKAKKEVEDKNKDITDSITYAKRIQRAMLPHRKDIWAAFPQSFVLFKPKDIVSGDFYFFHKNEQSVFIAAVDCTGHGVPGAFMSMIGADKLNEAVYESSETSEILSLLNKGIKTALKQSDSDESTRDGMDIALCSVDNENRIVKYTGANRPFYIIRKGQTVVEEIKATKKAIGGLTEDSQHFDTHEIKLQEGDTFYISTDGYGDTFSRQGKKLTTKKFKETLLGIQNKNMKEQEKHLDDFIENWKDGIEQVDDILVIGVRL